MTAYFASDNANGFVTGKRFSIDAPAPTVMAAGMGGDSLGHWHFNDDGCPDRPPSTDDKPPYRVPLLSEIEALPWNGLTVASTFSGGGGSCTGYRMAGYRVLWANEFLPAAQETYRTNHPTSVLDDRDIRLVRPEDILQACGLSVGDLDLFDGSPPCQAFSTAGKREKGWGEAKVYENGARQCNERLFQEYIRLLDGIKPRVFVAENVSGLVKGVAKGYFKEILRDLKACGYRVSSRLLDAQWLGVPQARQRIIFVGVRDDLGLEPVHPKPLRHSYTVRDALPWISEGGTVAGEPRKFTIKELKRICAFPDDYHLVGTHAQQWERLGNSVPPVMMFHIASEIRDRILMNVRKNWN